MATERAPGSEFGKSLRAWRKSKGYTTDGLSLKCGLNRSCVGMYEVGRIHPTPRTCAILADILGIPFAEVNYAAEESKKSFDRSKGIVDGAVVNVPCKAFLPHNVAEWVEDVAEHKGKTRSWVIAMLVMQRYFEFNGEVSDRVMSNRLPGADKREEYQKVYKKKPVRRELMSNQSSIASKGD